MGGMSNTYYDESYPPSIYAPPEPEPPADGRDSASPTDTFTDAAITAQDLPNAAKLTGLGFVANPQTAWLTGEHITVNAFQFYWNGSAWLPGAPAEEPAAPQSFGEPVPIGDELPPE